MVFLKNLKVAVKEGEGTSIQQLMEDANEWMRSYFILVCQNMDDYGHVRSL